MAESILNKNMEKAQTESNLSIINNDMNIELSKEFLEELQMNAYHEWINEDVMDHIAKVLQIKWKISPLGGPVFFIMEVDIIKKTENRAKMTKLSMEWKRL
ncbi:hypothetical protein Tco_1036304 [Tanacetum coccineum]